MNREEIISYLKAYLDGDTNVGNVISLREVLESAIEHLEPNLPSNLDEAAENIYKVPFGTRAEDFMAGAELMAKQGVSMEVVRGVPWRAIDAFIHDYDYKEDSIIQIRKK